MSRVKKPSVDITPVANRYAARNERIVEVTGQHGIGCLISVRNQEDGTVRLEVYRVDNEMTVVVPGHLSLAVPVTVPVTY